MKIFLIVEGDSDEVIFKSQKNWFDSLGINFNIRTTGGKQSMIRKAKNHYKVAFWENADYVIFLPDQNGDMCALATREKIGLDSYSKVKTIVMKLEMEAWILADGQCIRNSINIVYEPPGQTDRIVDPKSKLFSIMKKFPGFVPIEKLAAEIVAPYFSIERAARNNTSAKRFKEFIENIVQN